MEFNKGEGSFFKRLLRDSEDYFPIPSDFAKKYLEEGSNKTEKVVLKTISGKKWTVGYLKIEGTYYFVNGWLKFVKDNGLESTYYVVFWLRSPTPNAIFRVAFYSPNGSPEHLTCQGDGASFIQILFRDSDDYLALPFEFSKKYLEKDSNITEKVLLKTKSGGEWPVKHLKIGDTYYFLDGWLKFINENAIQQTDFIVFSLRSLPPNAVFRVYLYSSNGSIKHSTSSSGNIHLKAVPNVGNRSNVVKETRDNHSSGNKMLFEKVIHAYILKDMPLPEDFERVTGIDCRVGNQVRVKNDQGTVFIMKTTIWKRPRRGKSVPIPYIREGWSEFLKASNVEVGDTCVFYYVKDDKMLHVHVKKTGGSEDKGKKRKRGSKSKE